MSIASRITEIETHIGDIYDELEIGGADLTNVNKNIVNIKNQLIDRYLDYLNNGTQEIWDNWEKVTGTGTTLTLTPTEHAPMKIDLKGNASQSGTPTPTSPIPVHVVSGDNVLSICGKNLFDKNDTSKILNCLINGTTGAIANYTGCKTLYIPCQPNTTYTVSRTAGTRFTVGTTSSTPTAGLTCSDLTSNSSGSVITLTTNTNAKYLCVFYYNSGSDTLTEEAIRNSIQIEANDHSTTYEPYIGQDYPIYLPVENLIQLNEISLTVNTLTDLQLGKNLPIGTYTFDGIEMSGDGRFNLYGIDVNDTQDNLLTNELTKNIVDGYSFTTTKIYKGIKIYTNVALSGKIQLEPGTKANSYTPYGTTPIELCKIGIYQDYIYKDNGSWYLHKEIGEVVLDGSEEGWFFEDQRYRINNIIQAKPFSTFDYNNPLAYSNYFKWGNGVGSVFVAGAFWYVTSGLDLSLQKDQNPNATTLADFKTWLSTNKPSVYYVLETPTTTEITDSTLIEQLEALNNAKSYENQTNISQVNNDLPFILNVSALKKEV